MLFAAFFTYNLCLYFLAKEYSKKAAHKMLMKSTLLEQTYEMKFDVYTVFDIVFKYLTRGISFLKASNFVGRDLRKNCL